MAFDRVVSFTCQNLVESAISQNLSNKGFTNDNPSTGCTYVAQPPEDFQRHFRSLQEVFRPYPIAPVRIPHATVIAAKVVDQRPNQKWGDLCQVQKVYQSYLLYFLSHLQMNDVAEYRQAAQKIFSSHEGIIAEIATKSTPEEALSVLQSTEIISAILERELSSSVISKIRALALASLNETSFSLRLSEVSLTSNGSILFMLEPNDQLLQMRQDLIIAGQGISKWPKLSLMKHAWTTVGYLTQNIDANDKAKIVSSLQNWVETNQDQLKGLSVLFNVDTLGSLAFRSNDFNAVKRVVFPMARTIRPAPGSNLQIQVPQKECTLTDLEMTPRTGIRGTTPTHGNRSIVRYPESNLWLGEIDCEVRELNDDDEKNNGSS